ncbi:MICOS complex subunit MIC60 isoform X2 [Brachyhypopomus gauderio]|uniref:MICOS complex subunit MIC60 isoform X2 n=1 Tax=Brachyhypopomus gauderio TaxID=698409 RepID=UPI0040416F09
MLRVCWKGANSAVRKSLFERVAVHSLQHCHRYASAGNPGSTATKIAVTSFLTVSGGLGCTILYAKWDPKFRTNIEKSIPYSEQLFHMMLGPTISPFVPLQKKQNETLPISSLTEATKDSKQANTKGKAKEKHAESSHVDTAPAVEEMPTQPLQTIEVEECHECAPNESAKKERPVEEVAARLVLQDQAEQDALAMLSDRLDESLEISTKLTLQAIGAQEAALSAIGTHMQRLRKALDSEDPLDNKSPQWEELEEALSKRSCAVDQGRRAVHQAKEQLEKFKDLINIVKESKIDGARPQILAAEEKLHNMTVDLDKVVNKVQTAQTEAKIMSQYSELVNEAKAQFQKELSSITPEVQTNWKGLRKLSADELNSLIAHAHRHIDQLNHELAEQRVREQIRIDAALEQQRREHERAVDRAVATALEHSHEEMRLQQDKKIQEAQEVMEAEMRTQLRRQAAAHTDHLRELLKVQEQELREEAQESLNSKLMEQETQCRRLTQEQLDSFTLDMNTAYARLKAMEEAIDSHVTAEEDARRAHQLWLSIEALNYTLKTAGADSPTEPLESAVHAIKKSCPDNEFAQTLATALPEESLTRGIYSEASLRARFHDVRQLARRVALIDEAHNSLYQYFLSYLQSVFLLENEQEAPPPTLAPESLDTFKLLAYASYCIERGDLELAAKFVNQLQGESRRVSQDWLKEARLTLETKQVVSLLSAYANAVGLGTTQAP